MTPAMRHEARTARGAATAEAGSRRRCIVSGEVLAKEELLRFVVGPDGAVVPDLAGRLPGRGLWLRPSREGLERAIRRGLFARAARRPVEAPDRLVEEVGRQLRRRCLDCLAMAKRAGQAVAGHDKVRAWLSEGKATLLLQAADGAPEGRRRLAALGRGVAPGLRVIEVFDAAELGRALGRDAAVHVAVAPGGLADKLGRDAARLRDYESVGPEGAGSERLTS